MSWCVWFGLACLVWTGLFALHWTRVNNLFKHGPPLSPLVYCICMSTYITVNSNYMYMHASHGRPDICLWKVDVFLPILQC